MLLMAGGVVILEDGQTMVMSEPTAVLVDMIRCKFIFRSATLSPPYKQSNTPVSLLSLSIQENLPLPQTPFSITQILDVNSEDKLVNFALALGATVTTQQTVHGPALLRQLDVATSLLDVTPCVDGTANKEDHEDNSAHKRMR